MLRRALITMLPLVRIHIKWVQKGLNCERWKSCVHEVQPTIPITLKVSDSTQRSWQLLTSRLIVPNDSDLCNPRDSLDDITLRNIQRLEPKENRGEEESRMSALHSRDVTDGIRPLPMFWGSATSVQTWFEHSISLLLACYSALL